MKKKVFVVAVAFSLLFSGMMVAVRWDAVEGKESVEERIEENNENENEEITEIHDWHDLDGVRDDLNGTYSLMSDLDEDTEGYDDYNSQIEDREVEEYAGFDEDELEDKTWDEGDTIDIPFDEENYDDISVEDDEGNSIAHTLDYPTITIEEDTEEAYLYVIYENFLVGWEPIGDEESLFTGTFDGNGHEISGLYINRPRALGLFGSIGSGAEVGNVALVDTDVSGDERYIGALCGYKDGGMIFDSYATGSVSGGERVGGLVGSNLGMVVNSYATGNVSGNDLVGGLVGINWGEGTVLNSYATGNVSGNTYVGGLIGENFGPIEDSYAIASINGESHVGGLLGQNRGMVENSYAAGNLSGEEDLGGLVGKKKHGTVVNSFWDIEMLGIDTSDGGTGKTTEQMKDAVTYTNTATEGLNDPWDFVGNPYNDEGDEDIWDIDEDEEYNDGYPFLSWEIRNELRIQIEGNGSTEPEEGTHAYEEGSEVTVEATPSEGWEFVEWTGDESGTDTTIKITMDADREITAVFEEKEDDGEGSLGFPSDYWWLITLVVIVVVIVVGLVAWKKKSSAQQSSQQNKKTHPVQGGSSHKQSSQRQKNEYRSNLCPTCGQPIRYIKEYDRWYCDNCEEYK
ncbi:MAG: GLUG motif-containing protein [Candidatus Aenigmatarchaeota archaeon]